MSMAQWESATPARLTSSNPVATTATGVPNRPAAETNGRYLHDAGDNMPSAALELRQMAGTHQDPRDGGRHRGKHQNKKHWTGILGEFCASTTFHGLRQVAEQQPFIIRRLMWLLLVLAGLALFLVQISESILFYYSWPVSVNVRINYNDSIRFPAVTICNPNAFRATEAVARGHYDMLSELFSSGENSDDVNLEHYGVSELRLDDLYRSAAHRKEDMIASCYWDGQSCDVADFVTTMTDFGVCYTFNTGHNGSVLDASRTGAEGGLRLLLNIEQYEYMPGPNEGAGLRLLAHPQDEIPFMRDLGMAVPPGSHAFVSIKAVEIRNLARPHGQCDSVPLQHHARYTHPNCAANCRQRYLQASCGCRDIYMPATNATEFEICNLTKFQRCMKEVYSANSAKEVYQGCECPIPCHRQVFESTVSYAYISDFDSIALLNSNLTVELQDRFMHAREISQRVSPEIVKRDVLLISQFATSVQNIDATFNSILSRLEKAKRSLIENNAILRLRLNFHWVKALEKVMYNIEHDFERGWTIMKERGVVALTHDFYGFVEQYYNVLSEINKTSSQDLKDSLALQWDIVLGGKLFLAKRALDNVTEAGLAYINGNPLLTFTNSLDRRYDRSYISPEILYKPEKPNNERPEMYIERFKNRHTAWFVESIDSMRSMLKTAAQNGTLDYENIVKAGNLYLAAGRGYNYDLFRFEDRVVKGPVNTMMGYMDEFQRRNRTLANSHRVLELLIENIKQSIGDFTRGPWSELRQLSNNATRYIYDLKVRKSDITLEMTSHKMTNLFRTVEAFFNELQSRGRDLNDLFVAMKLHQGAMWTNMLTEYTTRNFYNMVHVDFVNFTSFPDQREFYLKYFADLLDVGVSSLLNTSDAELQYRLNADFSVMNLSVQIYENELYFDETRIRTDILAQLGSRDQVLGEAFLTLHDYLQTFITESIIDSNFYINNFIQLDVFMQDISYEEIIQQEAYGLVSLWGDIGGSLGLFLGASALSVLEIVDVLAHQAMRWIFQAQ